MNLPARSFSSSYGAPGDEVSSLVSDKEDPRQSELIFLGTGTSEGIPRVSCLTHPSKTCPVWPSTSISVSTTRGLASVLHSRSAQCDAGCLPRPGWRFALRRRSQGTPTEGVTPASSCGTSRHLAPPTSSSTLESMRYCLHYGSLQFFPGHRVRVIGNKKKCSDLSRWLLCFFCQVLLPLRNPVVSCFWVLNCSHVLLSVSKKHNHANRLLLIFRLRTIDAVIITHSHADAIGGLQCRSTFSIPMHPCDSPFSQMVGPFIKDLSWRLSY